jgi:hypothetical protein
VSEALIRWHEGAASLPQSGWQAIERGASVTSVLKEHRAERAAARKAALTRSVVQRARTVAALAAWLIKFLWRKDRLRPGYVEIFFRELRARTRSMVVIGVPPIDSSRAAQHAIALCRPKKADYELDFAWLSDWTALAVISVVPQEIVDDVLIAAERELVIAEREAR